MRALVGALINKGILISQKSGLRVTAVASQQLRCFSATSTTFQPDLINSYRHAMGGIASSAMVITTTSISGDEPRGLTLSSITSLSLKPTPLVSFNVQLPSRTSEVLHDRNIFAINVLPATELSVRLARVFSGAYGHTTNPFTTFPKEFFVPSSMPLSNTTTKDKKTIAGLTASPNGVEDVEYEHAKDIPVISTASAILYCKKYKIFNVQDHEIWVASVFHVDTSDSLSVSSTLLYQNRAFHSLGPQLDEPQKS